MRRLVWKELRENARSALLALLVLGGAELYALFGTQSFGMTSSPDYYYNNGVTICKTTFLTVTTFGCPVVGLLQVLPELKRDRWAALLHRPVGRGTIFRGKAVAGILLYGVATVPPFLLAIWFAATPGHFGAPFVPGMVLPGSADICVGLAYYFAALTVALHRGGWVGRRVLPLLTAIHASFFVLDENLFYVAVEGAVLMSLALFTAAWGAMQSQTLLRARPWLGRFAFLAVIFYGICGAGDLVKSFLDVVLTAHSRYEQYQITREGVPLRISYADYAIISIQTVDGKPVTDPKYKIDRLRNHLLYLDDFSNYVGDARGWHPPVYHNSYRQSPSYLWANNPYSYPRMEQWFQMTGQSYLIGYLPIKKQAFALLDRRGFMPASSAPEPFSAETKLGYINADTNSIWDTGGVRFAFLARRQLLDLVLPTPGPVYGVGVAGAQEGNKSVYITGVVLQSEMALYDDTGTLVTAVPYHQDVDRWGRLSLGINAALDRFYLEYKPSLWIKSDVAKTMPSYFEEMDRSGQILHSYILPPLPNGYRSRTWQSFFSQHLQSPVFYFGTVAYKEIGAQFGSIRLQHDLNYQFGTDLPRTKEISVSIVLLSLFLSGVTLAWAKRLHFPSDRAAAWAAFVLAFNLAGFLTFRLAADWPRFVPCPTCTKRRPVEENSCPHCGSGWPSPEKTGTEIMEPAPELNAVTV